jgi:hypothetical protein
MTVRLYAFECRRLESIDVAPDAVDLIVNSHLRIHGRDAALQAFALFRKMEAAGARILFGHDPEFWKTIPQAPARLA